MLYNKQWGRSQEKHNYKRDIVEKKLSENQFFFFFLFDCYSATAIIIVYGWVKLDPICWTNITRVWICPTNKIGTMYG